MIFDYTLFQYFFALRKEVRIFFFCVSKVRILICIVEICLMLYSKRLDYDVLNLATLVKVGVCG